MLPRVVKTIKLGVSIPVLPARKAGALPLELIPQGTFQPLKVTRKITVIV